MENMPMTVRRYPDFTNIKADECRYWQSPTPHKRLDAVEEMITAACAINGWEMESDLPRIERSLRR